VLDSLIEGIKQERSRYHALELPTAQLIALTANINRDPKRGGKPYEVSEFCFFIDKEANKPEARAARAYMKLEASNQLPEWAVFCANDFLHGKGKPFLNDPAMRGDGFLLIAPVSTEKGIRGLLIAQHKVAGQNIEAAWEGDLYRVDVPGFADFVTAKAEVEIVAVRIGPLPLDHSGFVSIPEP